MFAGSINIGDLITIVYGLLPLLLDFDFRILLLVVIEGANVAVFADFMSPTLMVFARPDLEIDLVLAVAMGFQFQINLFGISNDCIIAVRYFLDHIVPVDSLIAVNFTVLFASEIRTADTKAREFNLIPRFAVNGLMIAFVSVNNLEGVFRHLIHTEGKLLVGNIRRQGGAILIRERLGNIDTLFSISLIMTIMEIEMPFSGRCKFFSNNPSCTSAVTLFHFTVGYEEHTSCCINSKSAS